MREKGSGTREQFEKYMLKHKVPIRTVFEGNSPEAIKKEVIDNNCLAVISICLVEEEVKNSQMHIIKNLDGAWDRHFRIVYHKNKALTGGMRSLIHIMKNYKYLPIPMKFHSSKLIE